MMLVNIIMTMVMVIMHCNDELVSKNRIREIDHDAFANRIILIRSYYYVADVVSLFGMMPLLVRYLGLHDMTIVILAVACQVHCTWYIPGTSRIIMKYCDDENCGLITIDYDHSYQAAKALVYFFAEEINTIYAIIFFSVFR